VAELQEMVRRLRSIREAEKEMDSRFQWQTAADPWPNSQKLLHQHTQNWGDTIVEENGSLQGQGPAGGRDFS